MTEQRCPLCYGEHNRKIYRDQRKLVQEEQRAYCRCDRCNLIFVPPGYFLPAEAEKAEYDRHQNHPQDPGYRRFLSRLTEPLPGPRLWLWPRANPVGHAGGGGPHRRPLRPVLCGRCRCV